MTPQEIQLVTDAVKIGFPVIGTVAGTVIGGISTYYLSRLNHRNDSIKELAKRRFELLIQTANDVIEFEHLIGLYATAVCNKVQGISGTLDFDEAKTNIHNKNQSIRRARMTLKILGLKDAEKKLQSYLELAREVVKFGPSLPKERAVELSKILVLGPTEFYEILSKEIDLP